MSIEKLFLFQVYVMEQDKKVRFHMQLDPQDNRFKIANRAACPASCLPLEDALHEAILNSQNQTAEEK